MSILSYECISQSCCFGKSVVAGGLAMLSGGLFCSLVVLVAVVVAGISVGGGAVDA